MKHSIRFIVLFLFFTQSIIAQIPLAKQALQANKTIVPNETLLAQFKAKHIQTQQQLAKRFPHLMGLKKWKDGTLIELVNITENGHPLFYKTNNIDAAATISTSKVWPGGALGLNLNGAGMTNRLGVWDGGAVLTSHREFTSRATQMDAPTSTNEHSTHVACTMIGAGIDSKAKGGAFAAPIKCYDWTNDDAEMTAAANLGLLISNHSYGLVCGWTYNSSLNRYDWYGDISISTKEDYKFGFYLQSTADWDQIALSNPNYLIFKAAGNDRGDKPSGSGNTYVLDANQNWVVNTYSIPQDGPYDCVGPDACGKNTMTIGAISKIPGGYTNPASVVMSSFSGWGPTDDGRIKPDLVACGVDVYSASNVSNSSYTTMSGTSMATPNASGSALLVQQYYNQMKGQFMKAATLKALLIHTADEAGAADGPDYSYGWGLMNTAAAVSAIKDTNNTVIFQNTLANGGTYTYTTFNDGSKPLKVTINWMDVPGTPPAASLDPTNRMLVNDLDVRIVRNSDQQVFYPYVMNPANPTAAATTGDNSRDNVEQIMLKSPTAGSYTITVTHKGSLTGLSSQPFSMIISGITVRPVAAFNVNTRTTCTGSTVNFTDLSGAVTARTWYFPGGTPSTSTAANPAIVYTKSGNYPVALKVVNSLGTDSIYIANYIQVGGLNLPFIEDFEGATVNLWSVSNPGADSTWRIWKTGGTSPGNLSAGINNYDNPSVLNDYLFTPILNFYGYQTVKLDFQHAYTRLFSTESDSLIVGISTDCGATFTRLLAKAESGSGNFATAPNTTYKLSNKAFVPATSADWCGGGIGPNCFSIDLTAFAGKSNIQVVFMQVGAGGNNMFLDNIRFTGTPFKPIANIAAPDSKLCSGKSFQLNDSSANVPATYSWSIVGTNLTSSAKNPIFTITQAGTYSVKLVVSNASGSDSITKSNFLTILPGADVPTLSANRSTICSNDSALLTASGSTAYEWWKNGIVQNNSGTTWYVKDAASYQVKTSAINGCVAFSTPVLITKSESPAKPIISKTLSGNLFCEGGSFTLTSSADSANQWFLNNSIISGQATKTLNCTDGGVYQVRAGNKGCFTFSDTLTITKLAGPKTSEIFGGNGVAYHSDTNTFYVTGGLTGSNFTWGISGGTITNGQGSSQILVKWSATASTASLSLQETATNGCKSGIKTRSFALFNTGINESIHSDIQMYPVPVKSGMDLLFNGIHSSLETLTIDVYSIDGKCAQHSSANRQSNAYVWHVNGLTPGTYFIKIDTGTRILRKQCIIE